MNWFYAEGSQQKGPVSDDELAVLTKQGVLKPETLLWHEGQANWQPLLRLRPDLAAAVGTPVIGGTAVPEQSKDLLVQQIREGVLTEVSAPGAMQYVGFWWRFLARFIDGIILMVAQQVLQFIVMMVMGVGMAGFESKSGEASAVIGIAGGLAIIVIAFGLHAGYNTWMVARYQATLGKLALGFKIVTADGGRVRWPRALGRWAAHDFLNTIILYVIMFIPLGLVFALGIGGFGGFEKMQDNPAMIGWILGLVAAALVGMAVGAFPWWMAAFDPEKRTLHDRICATRVVRK